MLRVFTTQFFMEAFLTSLANHPYVSASLAVFIISIVALICEVSKYWGADE